MLDRSTFSVLLAMFILAGCGSDGASMSDDEQSSDDDPVDIDTEAPKSPPLDESLKPLLSAEGAEAGLKGCLNRGLYVNGPHTVLITQRESFNFPYREVTENYNMRYEYGYDVMKVNNDNSSEVAVTTTVSNLTTDTVVSIVVTNILEGHATYEIDPFGTMPSLYSYVEYFDIDEGGTVPQTINLRSEVDPFLATQYDTYVGREDITIAGKAFKACRIDSDQVLALDDPEFKRNSLKKRWFAVGTGLLLRTEETISPDSERDTIIRVFQATAAEINGNKIF